MPIIPARYRRRAKTPVIHLLMWIFATPAMLISGTFMRETFK